MGAGKVIKSMTGFGRDSIQNNQSGYVIEIKSVNHRYLDLNIKMPRNLVALEDRIRKYVQKSIARGKVDVFITQNNYCREDIKAYVNNGLADSYFKCLTELKDEYNLKDPISLSLLAKFPDVIYTDQREEDIEAIWSMLSVPLKNSIDNLIIMRYNEGDKLADSLKEKCGYIKTMIDSIEEKSPIIVNEYKNKLNERIKELLGTIPVDEARLALEISIFADKASIDEEIVRLNSHIHQFLETIKEDGSIGRKLDFIVQEMNRETNTIASKANDISVINLTLNIKNEIEKIREQIQNIE
jgi:uncharacterized protein (TIGR00255 family)